MRKIMAWAIAATSALGAAFSAPAANAADLRIFTWSSYLSPELVDKFERETGVRVVVDTVTNYVDMLRPIETGKSGYDVFFPADFHVKDLAERGLIEKINPDRLPNYWNVMDNWRYRALDPRNEYTVPHVWGTTAFVVDTAQYKGDINTLKLLFDPPKEIDGRIVLMESGYDMIQLALVYIGEPRCSVKPEHLAKVENLLAPMLKRYEVPTIDTIVEALTDPKVVLGVAWNGDALRARQQRPSLRYAYPREGNLVWSDVMAVPKGAPNKSDAIKFLSFMMKPENAALQSSYTGYANMIRGSEKLMDRKLTSAPEIITPISSSMGFFTYCDNAAEKVQDVFWKTLKEKVKGKN